MARVREKVRSSDAQLPDEAVVDQLDKQLQGYYLKGADGVNVRGILGVDSDVRNGFSGITVTYDIEADATPDEVRAIVAQSQKRSAVYDVITNPVNVTVEVV